MGKKLYRYRTFNTAKETGYSTIHDAVINIEKWKFEAFEGLVYPSSPLYFNDPYDCDFCFRPDILEHIIDRETYVHLLERKFSLKPKEKDRILYSENIGRAMQIVLQAHGGKLSDSWMNILKDSLSGCMDKLKDAVRVVCLSEEYDSMLMWSHYAQNHTGYCIEYDFEESDIYYKHLYPITYAKDRYVISKKDVQNGSKDLIYKTTCRKSDVWAYEKEWRIVIANISEMMRQRADCLNEKYVLDLKSNIKAFYMGAKTPEDFKEAIVIFGKENNIGVYEMILSSETYELEARKIV